MATTAYNQRHRDSSYVDRIIGILEDLLVDDRFTEFQNTFFEEHAHVFEDSEENKLVYMTIFDRYKSETEAFMTNFVMDRDPDFSLEEFSSILSVHPELVETEIVDLFCVMGDFLAFKELVLAFKKQMNGAMKDLATVLIVSKASQ